MSRSKKSSRLGWIGERVSGLFGRSPLVFARSPRVSVRGVVVAVLRDVVTGSMRTHQVENIVTDPGDIYYAQRAVLLTTGTPISPVPTNFTDTNGVPDMIMELYESDSGAPDKGNDRSDLGTLITDSDQAMDSGYPLVNDSDPDNAAAGVDVATYRVSYATGDANGSISDVILTNPSPGASEAILMHAEFGSPFVKTSADTLKVFVNHTFTGV